MDDKDKIIKLLEEKVERLERDLMEAGTAKVVYVPYERPWQPVAPYPYSPWSWQPTVCTDGTSHTVARYDTKGVLS